MKNIYNFKCKKCGHLLTQDGKMLSSDLIFFMCINGGCGESIWIDVVKKIDNQGENYNDYTS